MRILLSIALLLALLGCSNAPRLTECRGKATPVNPQPAFEVSHGARSRD